MTNPELIQTSTDLEAFCAAIADAAYLAVDTEFVRERTYYPRLCLVQVASESTIGCIDAIALDDLSPLMTVLLNPTITKALHAGRQDLEIFFNLAGAVPAPVFDTQIAADLCGLGDQAGLAAVVAQLLDVEMDKSHTRTDWSKRPLSPQQLQYALDDVRYLLPVYQFLERQVAELGRAQWLAEDCKLLASPELYSVHPSDAWQRVKGLQRLRDKQFHAGALLADWRERRAMAQDRPRGWVLHDDLVVAMAEAMPTTAAELATIERMPKPLLRNAADELLAVIATASGMDEQSPEFQLPLTGDQRKLVSTLMSKVRQTAVQLGIPASTLATRRDVTQIVRGVTDIPVLTGWRRASIGETLQALTAKS